MEQFYLLRKQDKIYIFLHRSNSNEILLSKKRKKLLKTKNSYIKNRIKYMHGRRKCAN